MSDNWYNHARAKYRKERIKELADDVRAKIKGGKLFGEPIADDDQDAQLVAAYYIGQSDTIGKRWGQK